MDAMRCRVKATGKKIRYLDRIRPDWKRLSEKEKAALLNQILDRNMSCRENEANERPPAA
jgi:hypothetical protein